MWKGEGKCKSEDAKMRRCEGERGGNESEGLASTQWRHLDQLWFERIQCISSYFLFLTTGGVIRMPKLNRWSEVSNSQDITKMSPRQMFKNNNAGDGDMW